VATAALCGAIGREVSWRVWAQLVRLAGTWLEGPADAGATPAAALEVHGRVARRAAGKLLPAAFVNEQRRREFVSHGLPRPLHQEVPELAQLCEFVSILADLAGWRDRPLGGASRG